ncbi:hypothetical protein T11_9653 [Trichinella zimbabwensis]|uniref:Uncharacterized protein n=1 Tax=Trichinella zimbabwensis TaxID=268475 RepID=A0A0V1H6E8_9BILA|nr:hypothetical protein T11_9653 [Trichinella zimbabwensis]
MAKTRPFFTTRAPNGPPSSLSTPRSASWHAIFNSASNKFTGIDEQFANCYTTISLVVKSQSNENTLISSTIYVSLFMRVQIYKCKVKSKNKNSRFNWSCKPTPIGIVLHHREWQTDATADKSAGDTDCRKQDAECSETHLHERTKEPFN